VISVDTESMTFDLPLSKPTTTPVSFAIDVRPGVKGTLNAKVDLYDSSSTLLGSGSGFTSIVVGGQAELPIGINSSPDDLGLDDLTTSGDLAAADLSNNDLTGADLSCDTQNDPKNCGACGHDCTTLPNVATATGVTCASGKCVVPASACKPGFAHCSTVADDGCEADLSQAAHCGSCSACPTNMPNCTAQGGSYSCNISCASPTPDQCGNQCVDLQSDPNHCKACSTACTYAHAQGVCTQGQCSQGMCATGYAHCSSDPTTGCETFIAGTDANNCGGCNVVCKVGQVCSAGTCKENQVTCASPGITCQQAGCYQAGRYSISTGGGIVVDLTNGRNLWTRMTRNTPAAQPGHNTAVSDCATLVIEGVNGWRLPTYTELIELNYMTGGLQGCLTCNPAVDQAAFPDTQASITASPDGAYWSNTYDSSRAGWDSDNFCDGRNNYQDPGTGAGYYRCIHNPLP
jgi:hypothetical protein